MARRNDNDIKYDSLPLVGWGLSLDLTGKGHPIAKRVWDTYEHMMEYLQDANDSAVPGLLLTVTKDTEDKNGAYLVRAVNGVDSSTSVDVVRLATGETQKITFNVQVTNEVEVARFDESTQTLQIQDMRSRWETNF